MGCPAGATSGNRLLTLVENLLVGAKLSEYHSGYRAFSRMLLERLPIERNSDDFVFDNQMLAQVLWLGCVVAEVSCPTSYAPESSSIDFRRSLRYGLGCVWTGIEYASARRGLTRARFPATLRDLLRRSAP